MSTATFHRVPDHERLFANLAAVLVPGGELVAQCGGAGNLASVGAALREIGIDGAGSKLYATPEETDERLRGAGFSPVECWLHAEPTPFGSLEELAVYLRTVVLGDLVEGMPRERASAFAREVAGRLPSLKLDYVRLNIRARRREPGPDGAGPTAPSIVPRSRRTMASSPRPRDQSATAGPATGRGGRGHGRRVDDPVRQARSGS